MPLYLLPLLLSLVGCSLQKMALRSTSPVLTASSEGMMLEGNWDFFKASAPGNIKFLEVLWLQDTENSKLLSALIKTYSGYAFAVPETLYFADELEGMDNSKWKEEAIAFYTRSLDYGIRYLGKRGINKQDLLVNHTKSLKKKLNSLADDDLTAVLYTAQSWGSLINLQKDNIALVSQVPNVKVLFDYVCDQKPDIDHNICDIFFAQYLAARPKMLGGNPEKGEELFLKAIKKHPRNLLIRLSYIQHVIVPSMDSEKYEKHAAEMREEIRQWENLNREELTDLSPYKDHQDLNLYNAIAKKRFEIIERNKKSIF
jgi:hypothetical protein